MASGKDTNSQKFKDGSPNSDSEPKARGPNKAEEQTFQGTRDNQGAYRIYKKAIEDILGNSMPKRKDEAAASAKISSTELPKPRAPAKPRTSPEGPMAQGKPRVERPKARAEHLMAGEKHGMERPKATVKPEVKHHTAGASTKAGRELAKPGGAPQPGRKHQKARAEAPELRGEPAEPEVEVPEPTAKAPQFRMEAPEPRREPPVFAAKAPEARRKPPVFEAKAPEPRWEPPVLGAEAPEPRREPLVLGAKALEPRWEPLVLGAEAPEPRRKPPVFAAKAPEARRKPPVFEAKAPEPRWEPPVLGAEAPEPRREPLVLGAKALEPRWEPLVLGAEAPEPRRKPPVFEAKVPEPRWEPLVLGAEAPEPRRKPPVFAAEAPEPRMEPPVLGAEAPEPRREPPVLGTKAPEAWWGPPVLGVVAPQLGTEPPQLRAEAHEPGIHAPKAGGERSKHEDYPELRVVRPKIREVQKARRESRRRQLRAGHNPRSNVSFTSQETSASKMSSFDKEPLTDQRRVLYEESYQLLKFQDEDSVSSVMEKPKTMIEATSSSESDWPDVPEDELVSLSLPVVADFLDHKHKYARSADKSTSTEDLGGTFTYEFPKGYSYYSMSSEEIVSRMKGTDDEYWKSLVISEERTQTCQATQPYHQEACVSSLLSSGQPTITEGYIDTHCHLDLLYSRLSFYGNFTRFRKVYSHTFSNEFEGCITDFYNPSTLNYSNWEEYLQDDVVWGTFGCNPSFAHYYSDDQERSIVHALKHPKAVAFGEMGLDYSDKCTTPIQEQLRVFERQLRLAVCLRKPVVIYCQNADKDMLAIMKKCVPQDYKIHRHGFTDGYQVIEPMLEYFTNMYVGFTAVLTYSSSWKIQDALKRIPLERVLVESDAPYFRPSAISRAICKCSHPGMVMHTVNAMVRVRNEPLCHILATLRENTRRFYNI